MEESISELLNEAIENAKRKPFTKARHASIKLVLTKFAEAMEMYILFTWYGRDSIQDYYEESVLAFAKVPVLEKIKLSEDFIVLLKCVEKISNILCNSYRNFYIPCESDVEKMSLLVKTLKINNIAESTTLGGTDQKQSKTKLTADCQEFLKSSLARTVQNQIEKSRKCKNLNTVETKLRNDLREALEYNFPNHKLHIFGSRASGEALDDSDFDFYCDVTGDSYERGMTIENQRKYVGIVAELLKRNTLKFEEVVPIPEARVPIVKFVHKPTNMDCDIGFKDGSGVENTKLLKVYLDLDPRVRWVLTAVKLWADANGIKNNRYFSSHGLSWLVLFYLMKTKLVPPFKDLQKNCGSKIINGWNTAFTDPKNSWLPHTEDTPLELFKGFFRWVVTANLTAYVLSPYTGDAIPKESFKNMTWLKNHRGMDMNEKSGLCIHDAMEHDQNIVSDIKGDRYKNFIDMCSDTFDVI